MFFLIAALSLQQLQPIGVNLNIENHRGHRAVPVLGVPILEGSQMAMIKGMSLQNGVIEADIAGAPRAGSPESARGFVGIAFHADANGYECFYLRPTNGRADDQVRRNHSAQYISYPDFPWFRLRKEFPEKYESYTD